MWSLMKSTMCVVIYEMVWIVQADIRAGYLGHARIPRISSQDAGIHPSLY